MMIHLHRSSTVLRLKAMLPAHAIMHPAQQELQQEFTSTVWVLIHHHGAAE